MFGPGFVFGTSFDKDIKVGGGTGDEEMRTGKVAQQGLQTLLLGAVVAAMAVLPANQTLRP